MFSYLREGITGMARAETGYHRTQAERPDGVAWR